MKKKRGGVEVWRGRNGQRKERLPEAPDGSVEMRVVKKREFYEERAGCEFYIEIYANDLDQRLNHKPSNGL